MKFILASCLLFFSFFASGQVSMATLDLLTKSMQLVQKGEYEKAIPLLEKANEAVKKEVGENHSFYSGQLFLLGLCHQKLYHYELAEKIFLRQKELLAKNTGEKDKSYGGCLIKLANLYREMGRYQQSEALYIQVKAISKQVTGESNTNYSTATNNLGSLYQLIGQYLKAEQLYTESLNILKRTVGENNVLYAGNLNNMATLYVNLGQYQKAKLLLVRVLEIRKNILGETHPDYAESLNNLAALYGDMDQFAKAEPLYKEAIAITKKTLGENHHDYAIMIDNLALLYKKTGRYELALQHYMQAGEIRMRTVGESHPDLASSLMNIAELYVIAGQYEKAEPLYMASKDIIKKTFGEVHPEYATVLNNFGSLYESMGQYKKAESFYMESIAIKKKIIGESHISYATALNNLAFLYFNIGQFEKAEPIFSRAMQITGIALGENNPAYATNLDNLANVWQSLEQFSKAELAYTRAMAIRKKTLGENNDYYARSLNNLASLYTQLGQYKKAEPLIVTAKDIWKNTLGETSPAYATGINNLAAIYRKSQTQYAKAEELYLEAIRLRKMILGEHHPFYSISQNGLALLYTQMGQYKKAEPLYLSSSNIVLQNIAGTFSILSEKEKGNFLNNNKEIAECGNSYLYINPKADASIAENNYDLELGFKSLSLADTRNMLELLRNSKDTAVKRIFDEWAAVKNMLAKQYTLAPAGRSIDLKPVEAEAESLEKELNRRSSVFGNQQKTLRITTKDIQNKLATDEAAIEFVRFRFFNKKWTDSVIYGAYILRKDDAAPQFVPLCEKKQLQQLFDSAGNTATRLVKSFYRGLDVTNKETARLGSKMYKLIWEPLEPFLKGIKKVSYSPAGKLYGIAFHALPVDSTTILMDKYQLQQYTSTRQISFRTENKEEVKPGSIVLFGNAMFTMDSLQLVKQRKNNIKTETSSASSYISKNRGNENGVWLNLPGTAEEVKKISQLFEENKISTQSFIQESASEENLKGVMEKKPQILHIATHGFFLPESNKKKGVSVSQGNAYSLAEDPLLRTGLVLAGGNYAWSGKTPVDGVEDGIATAYEISQLNLSNTELLVLSACETALGDIKGSEGVFGLQRGFKMAGVKKMIVSLWQVPDKETAELMTAFYSYWINGKNINESFYQAQADMRKKYAAYYWAAFVLVE
ncbi:MAG: CHAT domain-containing tetratricopeptide repeat protein [Bacteroidota bacterium]|nr:CHAT domain-containing tetratricopeptide repeat protein [Bacteroidota bacterium]